MKQIFLGIIFLFSVKEIFSQNIFAPPKELNFDTETHYSAPNSEPKEHPIDIEKMRAEVSFEPEISLVKGIATHIFRPIRERVDSVYFNAVGIKISQVFLNGKALRHYSDSAGFYILPEPALKFGELDSIKIFYEANPRKGIYFTGWNDATNRSRKQIWTQGESSDNRHWIPMYDEPNDKMITETIVTFDKNYSVLSNGTKISEKENSDGTKTWHYTMTKQHSGYLLMLGIGKYAVEQRKSSSGVPINLWYYPDEPQKVEPTYRYITEAMDFMETETGIKYPWESYSQIPVQDFIFGAMENTTATIFGDFYYVDRRAFLDRNYIQTDVHELAHQWFGDLVTNRTWKHLWLHESFATFYPKIFQRKFFGEDEYQWKRRNEQNEALNASKQNLLPIVHDDAGSARIYPKGSAVLDMMMYTFGEGNFRRVLTHFLKKYSYQVVETNDLYQSFQDAAGITPDWFFDQWLYRGGEPGYKVSYADVMSGKDRQTIITVSQTHEINELVKNFSMPVVFEVNYADGTRDSIRKTISERTQTVAIPNPQNKKISFVLFDPGSYILKNIEFEKNFDELSAQAEKARNMIDRYDRIVALKKISDKEKFHAIKSEVAAQLYYDQSDEARKILRKALNDPDAEVRKAVTYTMPYVPAELQSDFEKLLQDSSYYVVENSLSKLSSSFPEKISFYLDQTKHERGAQNKIRIKWLEIKAGQKNSSDTMAALRELIDMTGNAFEFRTRQNAMEALKRLDYLDKNFSANLFEAVLHPNRRLAGVAENVAEYFSQQTEKKNILREHYDSGTWENWQKNLLEKYVR